MGGLKNSDDRNRSEKIVVTSNLSKQFNGIKAVNQINLSVVKGTIFGFIGPSGCGKTTTVRLLLGIYRPTSGSAHVFGIEPHKFSKGDREKIGYMPQLFMLQPDLSVRENLVFAASLYGLGPGRRERIQHVLELVELRGEEQKLARDLSGGMQRRLSLAAAVLHQPELYFLDEPTGGIDPVLRKRFWDHFQNLKASGRTLFITTQYVGEAAYCDHVAVMAEGQLLMVETPQNLRRLGMGGEVIRLVLEGFISKTQLERLRSLPFVLNENAEMNEDHSIRIVVENAAQSLPQLLKWADTNRIQINSADRVEPSFDDVFVQIIENWRQNADQVA